MAQLKDFNPKAVVVVRRQSGLSLGGQFYGRGDVIDDDSLSVRKKLQLYRQNILCHPHEIEEAKKAVVTPAAEVVDPDIEFDDRDDEDFFEDETYFDDEDSEDVKPETDNGDDPDANVATGSETQESEGESSEEVTVPKPRRRRNPKSSKTKAA